MDKDIKKILKDLKQKGWRVEHGTHFRCYHPNGKDHLTIAKSPRCNHAVQNILSDIKRIERRLREEITAPPLRSQHKELVT